MLSYFTVVDQGTYNQGNSVWSLEIITLVWCHWVYRDATYLGVISMVGYIKKCSYQVSLFTHWWNTIQNFENEISEVYAQLPLLYVAWLLIPALIPGKMTALIVFNIKVFTNQVQCSISIIIALLFLYEYLFILLLLCYSVEYSSVIGR